MTRIEKNSFANGSSAVKFALTEPLSAGDVYTANTESVDFWAVKGRKEVGNLALLGLPSLVRRFTRCKNAHEYVRASLLAIPTVPLAAVMALGGGGSMLVALALPMQRTGGRPRSREGVWEERLARALDLNAKALTDCATRLSRAEIKQQLNQERTLLADVGRCLAGRDKRTRCSGMLRFRLRAWSDQIGQLDQIAK